MYTHTRCARVCDGCCALLGCSHLEHLSSMGLLVGAQEWWGVTPEIKDQAEHISRQGGRRS